MARLCSLAVGLRRPDKETVLFGVFLFSPTASSELARLSRKTGGRVRY